LQLFVTASLSYSTRSQAWTGKPIFVCSARGFVCARAAASNMWLSRLCAYHARKGTSHLIHRRGLGFRQGEIPRATHPTLMRASERGQSNAAFTTTARGTDAPHSRNTCAERKASTKMRVLCAVIERTAAALRICLEIELWQSAIGEHLVIGREAAASALIRRLSRFESITRGRPLVLISRAHLLRQPSQPLALAVRDPQGMAVSTVNIAVVLNCFPRNNGGPRRGIARNTDSLTYLYVHA
jgi:hypothetical protein